jgi:hypothetical protein
VFIEPLSGNASTFHNTDGGNSVHVTNMNFLWEDMDNYNGGRKIFTRMFGTQNSAQGVTDMVDVFELFFDKELAQTIVD